MEKYANPYGRDVAFIEETMWSKRTNHIVVSIFRYLQTEVGKVTQVGISH